MIARRPSGGDVRGATPAHPLLFPVGHQDASLSQSPQQQLLDQRYIQRMFADGALGGLWLPEPQYLYEDSAGTIPASTNGVCGLWMDCSRDLVLGNELVIDPGFNNPTAWTAGIGISVSNSKGIFSNVENGVFIYSNSFTPIIGRTYKVSFEITSLTSGSITMVFSFAIGGAVPGIYRGTIVATSIAAHRIRANSTTSGEIDNFSFIEILGTHAIQATLANKPTLRRTPVSGKYWLDSNNINATGAMTATFPSSLGSACTIARANADGVTITPNQTITTTYNLTPPYGYNSAVMVINRALTASEAAVVTRYLRNWVPLYGSLVNAIPQMRGYVPNNETVPGWSGLTSLSNFWYYGGSALASFPVINTSKVNNFDNAWYGCSTLTQFPLLDVVSGTSFNGSWRSCSSLISFPLLNTANGIDFSYAWRFCSALLSFPLINTSKSRSFLSSWYSCASLASFPANFFDAWAPVPMSINCFLSAWYNCTSLTQQSVQNILVSIATSGQSAPASGTDITLDGVASLATIQADSTLMTAVTSLKSRNWTPTYKGTAL